jgi:hypothetical protein
MEEGVVAKKKSKKSRVISDEDDGFGKKKKQKLSRAVKKTLAKKKQSKEKEEIAALDAIIASQAPDLDGTLGEELDPQVSYPHAKSFEQLPISKATKSGLKQAKFDQMTAIQRAAIPQVTSDRSFNVLFIVFSPLFVRLWLVAM